MSSNRSSTLSFSLPPTPDDSRPTSSMSLYSNTSSVYYQPQPQQQYLHQQQPGYSMVYDHRHSVVNYNTHVQRHLSSHHHHHNNNNQDNIYQYEILDHEVNYPQSLLHKPSVSTIGSNFTQKLYVQQQQNLRKQVTTRGIYQQQQQHNNTKTSLPRTPVAKQKKMPLFPTVRTRGSSSIQDALRPGKKKTTERQGARKWQHRSAVMGMGMRGGDKSRRCRRVKGLFALTLTDENKDGQKRMLFIQL